MSAPNLNTRTGRLAIARQARKYGFFRLSERDGWIRCPLCKQRIDAHREINFQSTRATNRLVSWEKALEAAMLRHLEDSVAYPDEPESCTGTAS